MVGFVEDDDLGWRQVTSYQGLDAGDLNGMIGSCFAGHDDPGRDALSCESVAGLQDQLAPMRDDERPLAFAFQGHANHRREHNRFARTNGHGDDWALPTCFEQHRERPLLVVAQEHDFAR